MALNVQLSSDPPPRRLHGRAEEQQVVSTLLERARAEGSGVLVLRGPEGIGKSALLEDTVAQAEAMRVLQAVGVESESGLAFSGLHQLLRPLEDLIPGLPGPQATALRGALGLSSEGGNDLFLVGAAVLTLLATAAEAEPLLCVIEDAQWLDAASLAAITFAARRLQAEPVAMLFAARGCNDVADGVATELPQLRLEGLDAEASAALIADEARIPLAPEVLNRIVATAEGNPLVLLEVQLALTDAQRAGREQLPDPLPLTARLEDAFSSRVALLSDHAQLLLLVAAADSTGDAAFVLRAARTLGLRADDFETAESADLLDLSGDRVKFRHPSVRSAIYHRATFGQRQQVHNALAEVFAQDGEDDLHAWHRAAATLGPDDEVAAELERSAERAKARGGYASAAKALARAATLTSDSSERGARKLAAAELAASAGQSATAWALLEDARALLTDPLQVSDVNQLQGRLELGSGSGFVAHDIFMSAAEEVAELDHERAAKLLLEATRAALYTGDLSAQVRTGRRAQDLRRRLAPAVRSALDQMKHEFHIDFSLENRLNREPGPEARTIAYRIVQEALANTRKHSNASRVEVSLESQEHGLCTSVTDDGVGFDVEATLAVDRPGHLGLKAMRERAELAEGWLRIESRPGATTVTFWIPERRGPATASGADAVSCSVATGE